MKKNKYMYADSTYLIKKKYVYVGILILACMFFLIDPFNWWPIEVGKPCTPMMTHEDLLRPTCTGKIIFPWQRP